MADADTAIRAILLKPSPEWRERLFREGPCGAKPPTVTYCGIGGDGRPSWQSGLWVPEALVLAWEGEPVPAGCDRAHRIMGLGPPGAYNLTSIMEFAIVCTSRGLGTYEVIDG